MIKNTESSYNLSLFEIFLKFDYQFFEFIPYNSFNVLTQGFVVVLQTFCDVMERKLIESSATMINMFPVSKV